jgi:hypothetical protein
VSLAAFLVQFVLFAPDVFIGVRLFFGADADALDGRQLKRPLLGLQCFADFFKVFRGNGVD